MRLDLIDHDKQYCPASGQDLADAERRPRFLDETHEFVQCPSCGRILVPTGTGKFRRHQPRGRTTASLDRVRDSLWHYADKKKV